MLKPLVFFLCLFVFSWSSAGVDYYQAAQDLAAKYLWIGQGQRYLSEADISEFAKEAGEIRKQIRMEDLTEFDLERKLQRFPIEPLEIVKRSIIFTLEKRAERVIPRRFVPPASVYGLGPNNYYYYLGGQDGLDFRGLFRFMSMNNYPVLLSMLDQGFGRLYSKRLPELRVTKNMIAIMKSTVDLHPEQIRDILIQLENGEHIRSNIPLQVRVERPHQTMEGLIGAEINIRPISCRSIFSIGF